MYLYIIPLYNAVGFIIWGGFPSIPADRAMLDHSAIRAGPQ